MIGRLARLLLLVVAGAGMLVAAYALINTTFMLYDDEGYVLLTYRNFIAGGRLYDEVFTQYGPWPYVYHLAIDWILHTPLTHSIGRSLTAIHWTLTALLVGAITTRLTAQKLYALPASLACFGLLWQMSSEPSHPGSLICVILALGTLLIINSHHAGHWSSLAVSLGMVAALLVLTKINIGILFIAGTGVAVLRLTQWPSRWQTVTGTLAALGLLLIPWGLMGANLQKPWVLILAVQFTLSAAGFLWITPTSQAQRVIPPRTWIISLVAFVVTLLLVSGVVWSRGTTLSAMLQTVLLNPLRHPSSFMIGFTWQKGIWPVAGVCWTLAAWAGWELRYRGGLGPFTRGFVLATRTACLVMFIVNLKVWLTMPGINGVMVYCLPLLPIFLIPLQDDRKDDPFLSVRLWTAALALPQVLHVYPVAGSQMSWGTFLLLPLLLTGWHEASLAWAEKIPRSGRWLPLGTRAVLLAIGLTQLGILLHTSWARYITSKPFGLSGAENIRAGDRARLALRLLTLNASLHADVLFSRQGMFSYNLWSGVPTPTAQNATHWFWLLDQPAQAAIIERLRTTQRSALITSQGLDEFLVSIGVPMACPLQTFLQAHYTPLFATEGLHFLVPQGSRAVPFGRIEILEAAPGIPTLAPILWQTNLVLNGQLESLQLQAIDYPWAVRKKFSPANARIVLQPINTTGDSTGPDIPLPHAQPLRGLFRLNLYLDQAPDISRLHELELVGLDPAGNTLSESVF